MVNRNVRRSCKQAFWSIYLEENISISATVKKYNFHPYSDNYYIKSLSTSCRYSADWNYLIPLCRSCQRQQWEAEKDLFKDELNRTGNFIFMGLRYFIWKVTSLIGPLLQSFLFIFLNFFFILFILHNKPSSLSLPYSPLPISILSTIHSFKGASPSLGHQQSLVYQVEVGSGLFPHAYRLSKVTHHSDWASKKTVHESGISFVLTASGSISRTSHTIFTHILRT